MERFLARYRRLLRAIAKFEEIFGILLLVIIAGTILLQVFYRYALNDPLVWVLELSTYCFIWCSFVGVGYGLKQGRHICITTFFKRLPMRARSAMLAAGYLLVLVLSVLMIETAWRVVFIENRTLTASLPVNVPKSWFLSVPVLFSALMTLLTEIYLFMAEAWAALRGRPSGSLAVFDASPEEISL